MAQGSENLGKLQAEAGIDFSQFTGDVKKLEEILGKLTPAMKQMETGLGSVEKKSQQAGQAAQQMGQGFKQTTLASQALSAGLGYLGANSIQAVIAKVINLGREAVRLAINLQAVENRAKAVFGEAFPQMQKAAEALSQQFKRSASDIMEFQTGFALILDSVGASTDQIRDYSTELSKLAIVLGKARPDLSDAEIYQKLQSGIMGSSRALKELGIVMTSKALQDFASSEKIKTKIKDMTEEQAVMLRTMYLLKETKTLQEAAARATGQLGDVTKTTADKWKDLMETLGTNIMPFITAANEAFVDMLTNWIGMIGAAKNAFIDFITFGQSTDIQKQKAALDQSLSITNQNVLFEQERGIGLGKAQKSLIPAIKEEDFWANKSGSGEDASKKLEEAEKKVTEALKKQADANKENLTLHRETLLLRQKLGILTEAETAELTRINNRLAFKKSAIEDATKAWEDQVEAVKKVEDKIKDLNDQIVEERKKLADILKDIDRDTAKAKTEKLSDLVKELNDINKQLGAGEGNTVELENRRRQIEAMIDPYRQTKEGLALLSEADKIAGMNDLELIDYEAEQRKKEAKEAAESRIAELQATLDAEETKLSQLKALEAEKRDIVIAAMAERMAITQTNYLVEETNLKAHVDKMVEEYNRLAGAMKSSASGAQTPIAPQNKASGGFIVGPGGPMDDRIPAMLSDGEYVHRTAAVQYYGKSFMDAINSLRLPRFAHGGSVSDDHSTHKTANAQFHFHGDTAKIAASPALLKWHLRKAF